MSSSIDSSDGLAISLHEIARNSGVCIKITNLPIESNIEEFAKHNKISLYELVFYGGEEYEIVTTIPKERFKEATEIALERGQNLFKIGEVYSGSGVKIFSKNRFKNLERKGWIHLS
jgi:thiamine-monophosphate kinase